MTNESYKRSEHSFFIIIVQKIESKRILKNIFKNVKHLAIKIDIHYDNYLLNALNLNVYVF